MAKKKVELVLVSLLAGATYACDVRVKPGITKGLTDKQLDRLKESKCKGIQVVTENEAKGLIEKKKTDAKAEEVERQKSKDKTPEKASVPPADGSAPE